VKLKRSRGFTLTEILITLTVIGVVAALTIPTLLQNTNQAEFKTALKKDYGDLVQAYTELSAENSGIETVFSSVNGSANATNAFLTKLSYIKNCGTGMGCLYNTMLKNLDGSTSMEHLDYTFSVTYPNYAKAILSNGSMIMIYNPGCSSIVGNSPLQENCGSIYIDVNGAKPPNTGGKDFFVFWITKTGIYPRGSFGDGYSCSIGNDYITSWGCAYKYLYE